MNTFINAVKNQTTTTTNGMVAFENTSDACVDLFFKFGASRGKKLTREFAAAFAQNPELAIRIMLWGRDAREGAGERQLFRDLLLDLEKYNSAVVPRVLAKVPELGRFDDLLVDFSSKKLRDFAHIIVANYLSQGNGLCAKWMPRKGNKAVELRQALGLSPKAYRKLLVELTDVVETKMCARKWNSIDFGKVPSLAAARYKSAFFRNAEANYSRYMEKLKNGEAKVNAGAVYPYDVLKSAGTSTSAVTKAQWEALPNYTNGSRILPVVDVSGSMYCLVSNNHNLSCSDVAISLGIYISDKNTGVFKDVICTFSEKPMLEVLRGDILQKQNQLRCAHWGMSTNIAAVFDLILKLCITNKVAENDTPEYIMILSDMQFDRCANLTGMDYIKAAYTRAGYNIPKIIFWNLNSHDNVPVKFDEEGTALISGFSPSIMKPLLAADFESLTPERIMLNTIMNERYNYK